MHATVFTGSIVGVDGLTVEVEVDLSRGIPSFSIVGLPNAAVRESRERVTAAIKNSGLDFPLERITVNLAPADIKKEGAAFDLAIAMGVIVASARKKTEANGGGAALSAMIFMGELALDGTLRRVRGVLPVLLHARSQGFDTAVIPSDNFNESLVVRDIEVFGARTLADAVDVVRRGGEAIDFVGDRPVAPAGDVPHKPRDRARRIAGRPDRDDMETLEMNDVAGQEAAKRALLIAAAGGHHVLMVGPPGAGKTMLARRFPSLLPALDEPAALETTKIYSIAGLLDGEGIITQSPFRAPHHSASDAGLIGGGNVPRPGEVTLAHNGVLFLDELPEFKRHVLETLREPIEEGRIAISRARNTVVFPARFQLIAAMNPCPCGSLGSHEELCLCTPLQIERYAGKVSGPLLDRISIHLFVRPVAMEAFKDAARTSSRDMLEKVREARGLQRRRLNRPAPLFLNARLPARLLRTHCRLEDDGERLLVEAQKRLRISARGRGHILRVARTIADLEGATAIAAAHVAEAVQYRHRPLGGQR